ncbi:MAG TPA: peptidylprolyl isomerase [Thermoleophilaceae bacterium]|nr:peptidylprolyl isomerase [Thermoleophilaceae bacterium]
MPRLPVTIVCAAALLTAGCGDDDGDDGDEAASTAATEQAPAAGCPDVEAPAARADGGARRPRSQLDPDGRYTVVLDTSCGQIAIRLDQRTSPRTAASFASLASSGFYDDTVFHRIVPGFVIQGGDPTGTGSGGPGYSTRDVPPGDTAYVEGTVAMAKSAAEPPGTAGSQFYIVTGADAGLPPEYAVLGKVVRGLDVVQQIGALGDPASGEAGTPLKPVVIEGATVDAA